MAKESQQGNPSVNEFVARVEQFVNWVSEPIDAAIIGTVVGHVSGLCMDRLFKAGCSAFNVHLPSSLDPEFLSTFGGYQPLIQSFVVGSSLEQARILAVMCGVGSGISCAMEKLRGKEDIQTSMVTGFGKGVMMSLVTGLRGPEAISVGVMFALLNGGLFKVKEKLSKVKAEDVSHDKTGDMFSSIGLGIDHHAMNFNTGFFTTNALSLLADNRKEAKKGGKMTWF